MSEKKDFKYEAQEPVVVKNDFEDYEIEDVVFLTPARVKGKWKGGALEEVLAVDIANRKVYNNDGTLCGYSEKIFAYLDSINTLPENFFEAGGELYEKASRAVDEMEDIRRNSVGGI